MCFLSHQFFSTKFAISLQDRSKAVHDLAQCLCAFQGFWNASLPLRDCRLSDHTQQVYLIDSRNRMTKHHPEVQKELIKVVSCSFSPQKPPNDPMIGRIISFSRRQTLAGPWGPWGPWVNPVPASDVFRILLCSKQGFQRCKTTKA